MEYNYKRKRRREAKALERKRAALELSRPEMIPQPMPFQTNKYWAEEISAGPGPPKGRKRDVVEDGLQRGGCKHRSVFADNPTTATFLNSSPVEPGSPLEGEQTQTPRKVTPDQKPSTFDSLKDTIRTSLTPENWNLKRYEREDEPLRNLSDTVSRMWDRARPSHIRVGSGAGHPDRRRSLSRGRRRVGSMGSDGYDYQRAHYPEVNELHPPVVSQLPATRAEVAWMLQPPPSRAVMEGKKRPGDEDMSMRRPLTLIATTKEERMRRTALEASQDNRGITEREVQDIGAAEDTLAPAGASHDEGHGYDEDEDEEQLEHETIHDLRHGRRLSLPLVDTAKWAVRTSPAVGKHISSQLQRPPLAIIASARSSTSALNVVPASSPRLLDRQGSSPASRPVARRTGRKGREDGVRDVPPEFEYLVELCLPQMPARTRSSLPTGVWV